MISTKQGLYTTGAVLILLAFSTVAEGGGPVQGERLFRITRNKNDNIVCYDVHHEAGKLDKDNPVSVYWVIPSKQNKREDLSFMESRKAYGVSVAKRYGQDSLDITLNAAERLIRVTVRGGHWVALSTVDSREVAIDSVYVMADESSTLPSVLWVEIMGRNPATGEWVRKKITK